MMTLSTVYKNAYLEREVVDTALTLYLEVLKFRRMSMLCGPEGSKNLIVLPLEEKRRDENDEDEDTTKKKYFRNDTTALRYQRMCCLNTVCGGKHQQSKHKTYPFSPPLPPPISRLLMIPCVPDLLSYCELRSHNEEDALFSHDHILPLPLLVLRATTMLYFNNKDGESLQNKIATTATTVYTSASRVLLQSIQLLSSNATTADMEVIALRNVDALLDVIVRAPSFQHHNNEREGWSLSELLSMLITHDSVHLKQMKDKRSKYLMATTKMSMLSSIHIIHRWRCIGWVLEAMNVTVLSKEVVKTLFEGAADDMDCVGIRCLSSIYIILTMLMPAYVEDSQQKGQQQEEQGNSTASHVQVVTNVLKRSWECLEDFEVSKDHGYMYRMETYLKLAFSPTVFVHFPALAEKWFVHVMKHRKMTNYHLLQRLVMTCFNGCWQTNFDIATKYIPYITKDLLLYHEPMTAHLHESERLHYGPPPTSLVRIIVLWCLERESNTAIDLLNSTATLTLAAVVDDDGIANNAARIQYLQNVINALLAMNFDQEWIDDYMPTSFVHRTKIRCWQALCTLATIVVATSDSSDPFFHQCVQMTSDIVLQNNHATIRYYIEMFLARLLTGGGTLCLSLFSSLLSWLLVSEFVLMNINF